MTESKVSVHLASYIAAPYWPELEKLINIKKESGVSRARTPETRRKALDSYLNVLQALPARRHRSGARPPARARTG